MPLADPRVRAHHGGRAVRETHISQYTYNMVVPQETQHKREQEAAETARSWAAKAKAAQGRAQIETHCWEAKKEIRARHWAAEDKAKARRVTVEDKDKTEDKAEDYDTCNCT